MKKCDDCGGFIDSSCCCTLTSKIIEGLENLGVDLNSIIFTDYKYSFPKDSCIKIEKMNIEFDDISLLGLNK